MILILIEERFIILCCILRLSVLYLVTVGPAGNDLDCFVSSIRPLLNTWIASATVRCKSFYHK